MVWDIPLNPPGLKQGVRFVPTDAPTPTSPTPRRTAPSRRTSLVWRLTLVTTAVALITALIVAAVAVPQLRAAGQAQARQNLERTADALVDSLTDSESVPRMRPRIMPPRGAVITWEVVPPGGEIPEVLNRGDVEELADTGQLSTTAEAGSVLVVARVLPDGSLIILTEPAAYSGAAIAEDVTRLLTALLVGVLIAAAAGYFLARWLARPLRDAVTAAQLMAAGRRDVEVAPSGPMEVAEVADSLNELNAALALSEGRQREFLLSVSHELRTPLTSLRGYAEALNEGIVPTADVPGTAAIMVSESQRLERVVADLLDLARMGARDVTIALSDTDVTPLLAETATVWAELCRREGVVFRQEIPTEPMWVSTDPVRLRQILDNLLTNALRMTPQGQPIVLAGRTVSGGVEVQVRDGGPGLSADDLAVAFEPAELYSRYRGVRPVGSGVGLALVGRLSQRLGGQARAESAPEGGASFTVVLPSAPAPALG